MSKTDETLKDQEKAQAAVEKEAAKKEPAAPQPGTAEWYEEKIPVKLFKDSGKYASDVFVAVNGKGYRIRRGVEVMVPRFVARVLQESMDQDTATAELIEGLSGEYADKAKALGMS